MKLRNLLVAATFALLAALAALNRGGLTGRKLPLMSVRFQAAHLSSTRESGPADRGPSSGKSGHAGSPEK
jgi:hypothetical protein